MSFGKGLLLGMGLVGSATFGATRAGYCGRNTWKFNDTSDINYASIGIINGIFYTNVSWWEDETKSTKMINYTETHIKPVDIYHNGQKIE